MNSPNVSFFSRSDYCVVQESVNGNVVTLWSNKHWAMIVIPKEFHGMFIFRYTWGSDIAYINNYSIPVEWGPLMRG